MNKMCGACCCGQLIKNYENGWYECDNCEELFRFDDAGELQMITYNEWQEEIYKSKNWRLYGTLYI